MLDEERERNEKMEKILQDCQDQLEMEREIRMHLEQRYTLKNVFKNEFV